MEKKREAFEVLLNTCVTLGASDMHLSGGESVSYRVNGRIAPYGEDIFSKVDVEDMAFSLMLDWQKTEFESRMTVDLGYTAENGERFRVNVFREMGKTAMTVRHLDQHLMTVDKLGLPPEILKLAYLHSGLVLITGATGSGKSTTLSVLIDEINRNRECHILTVEDPVEFVHKNKKSLVHHREVKTDVPGFAEAVRASLREDPDVIMVGEMRDLETMQASITAAETGHLVFSTLHTGEAVGAVERFIGCFPGEEQEVARHRISMVLRAVIAQRLIIGKDGKSRIPAMEVLQVTNGAANLIKTSKTRQLYSLMECGGKDGMWTLDQDLARLVKDNKIHRDSAVRLCENPEGFDQLVRVVGPRGTSGYECQ